MLAAGPAPAAKRCFGAAARDPGRHCDTRHLSVTPTPEEAEITPNVACTRGEVADMAEACSFGVSVAHSVGTVALLGDSHAAHWRAGIAAVARARHWHVLEIARPHCPFSFNAPALSESESADCVAWNHRVVDWLAANPWLTTVFISNSAWLPMAKKGLRARIDGHLRALSALPSSVTRVWILRDPPPEPLRTHDCVERAVARNRPPGRTCATPRSRVVRADATDLAGEKLAARGVRTIDLTSFFCDSRSCFPVVGGVLVHKDGDHLTQEYSATLGHYILRAIS